MRHPDPEMTLLYFLRKHSILFLLDTAIAVAVLFFINLLFVVHLTGSKLGCGEGGCGACTVMVSRYDPVLREVEHFSVNACLAPLCSVDGMAVTTVEGIGSTKGSLHPCQVMV